MEAEIEKFLEVRSSSRAKRPKLKYSKGSFIVVEPEGIDVDVERLVEENIGWIERYLSKARKYREQTPERFFEKGEKISVLGNDREIRVEKRRTGEVSKNSILLAEHLVERNSIKSEVERTLKAYAREVFHEKAERFSEQVDGSFEKIFVRDQKTRWGSCSSKNNLNFNWRLVLAPKHVLEYVVVHELVHLDIMNHSEKFWNKVETILPEARKSEKWLEENSAKLVFDQ